MYFGVMNVQKLLDEFKVIYTTGFFLSSSAETLLKIADRTAKSHQLFGFNLSACFLIQVFKDQMVEAMEHSDLIFGNEDEAECFA
jgi:adenosine kinase